MIIECMTILNIHKFYHESRGAERYYFALEKALREQGHAVIPFCARHPENKPTPYEEYFVKYMDFSGKSGWGLKHFGRMLYSLEARSKLKKQVDKERIDVAHIHSIYHQISPSVLSVLKKKGIPIVMTVHDYKLVCPNYSLYSQGFPCTRCKKRAYWNAVRYRCVKGSYWAGLAAAMEMGFHGFVGFYEKYVDVFIVPSEFVRKVLIDFGYSESKIRVIPHFAIPGQENFSKQRGPESKVTFLYLGSLSEEKGILDWVNAFVGLQEKAILRIAGTGPLEEVLKDKIRKQNLGHIELMGRKTGKDLEKEIQESDVIAVPSRVWETFGLVVLEAYAWAKPVIVSSSGALPELVEKGKTGWIYEALNPVSLKETLFQVLNEKDKIPKMGKEGIWRLRKNFSKESHMEALEKVYRSLAK